MVYVRFFIETYISGEEQSELLCFAYKFLIDVFCLPIIIFSKIVQEETIVLFLVYVKTNVREGQSKIDNPEKLTTFGTQDEQNKTTRQYVFDMQHCAQTNTNNVNKTWDLQTTRGKDEPNIVYAEIITDITTRNSERKDT